MSEKTSAKGDEDDDGKGDPSRLMDEGDERFLEDLMHTGDLAMYRAQLSKAHGESKEKTSRFKNDYLAIRYFFVLQAKKAIGNEKLARELSPVLEDLGKKSWMDTNFYLTLAESLDVYHQLDDEPGADLSEEFLEERFRKMLERTEIQNSRKVKEDLKERVRAGKESSTPEDDNRMWR